MISLPLLNCRRWCVTSSYQMLLVMLPLKSLKYNDVTSITSILLIREKIERKVNDYAQITTKKTSAGYAPVPTCKKQVTQVTYNQISELTGNATGNVEVTGSDTSYACGQPIKVSVVPLVNPKTLHDVFASRVPTLGPLGRTRKRVVRTLKSFQSPIFARGVVIKTDR